jgi:hypothetical protein
VTPSDRHLRGEPPAEERRLEVDSERLRAAFIEVEAGYIYRPDRMSAAYWRKIAAAYSRVLTTVSEDDDAATR